MVYSLLQYVTVGEDPEDGGVLSGTSDHTTNNAGAEYQSGDICRLCGECER